ncbi:hypothetical protein STEG23_017169 [Scotinomys teguina]
MDRIWLWKMKLPEAFKMCLGMRGKEQTMTSKRHEHTITPDVCELTWGALEKLDMLPNSQRPLDSTRQVGESASPVRPETPTTEHDGSYFRRALTDFSPTLRLVRDLQQPFCYDMEQRVWLQRK